MFYHKEMSPLCQKNSTANTTGIIIILRDIMCSSKWSVSFVEKFVIVILGSPQAHRDDVYNLCVVLVRLSKCHIYC